MTKLCPTCNQNLPLTDFYVVNNGKKIKSYCKKCDNKECVIRQQALKAACVQYKGGKCQHCGYNKYPGAMDFHHIDPSQKDFSLSKAMTTKFTDKIRLELDKCLLLCSNCHREEHARLKGFLA